MLAERASELGLSVIERSSFCALHIDCGMKVRAFFLQLIEEVGRRLDGMAKQGINRRVPIWTDIVGYALSHEKAVGWHRLLNEPFSALYLRHDRHISILSSVPLPDAMALAHELAFVVEQLGAADAMVGANVQEVNLGELDLDEFWWTAMDLNVPGFIHPVQTGPSARMAKFALKKISAYTVDTTPVRGLAYFRGRTRSLCETAADLSHGGGAFAYLLGRFDCMRERMDKEAQGNVARYRPSVYIRRFYWGSLLHVGRTLRWLTAIVSVEWVVMGSDYSCPLSDYNPVETVREVGFLEQELMRILEGNLWQMFPFLARL